MIIGLALRPQRQGIKVCGTLQKVRMEWSAPCMHVWLRRSRAEAERQGQQQAGGHLQAASKRAGHAPLWIGNPTIFIQESNARAQSLLQRLATEVMRCFAPR